MKHFSSFIRGERRKKISNNFSLCFLIISLKVLGKSAVNFNFLFISHRYRSRKNEQKKIFFIKTQKFCQKSSDKNEIDAKSQELSLEVQLSSILQQQNNFNYCLSLST